ncbi:HEPN/Toprim-associated domain-containing protein [Actinoplanes sp. TRM 88003]|uniref:HEPN/Toprim-associated domain-containing protein n=1 Tax=Paractinoplanes aksuensis TaxID=2939490 RepID=A0ABT1DVA8_9ACTN|nr:HEPN/Toprim-associated domain-containing protein [Actinoplanes aksuensis]MCO8274789.1 HEPN/Toprim-associated domain-containing protein [Actinoplanes aksuensis]
MSEYQSLFLKNYEVFSYREVFRDETLHLFTSEEVQRLYGPEAAPFAWGTFGVGGEAAIQDIGDELKVTLLQSTSRTLRQRLDILGYSLQKLEDLYLAARDLEVTRMDSFAASYPDLGPYDFNFWKGNLRDLSFDSWLAQVTQHVERKMAVETPSLGDVGPLELLDDQDARWLIRAIVEVALPADMLSLDVTRIDYDSLLDNGFLMDTDGANYEAVFNPGPPIVITEGRYDAKVLREAIEILMPHLEHYIRFLDFDFGNEGGASAAVKTLKSFAAAGISNRIVALFDNDSAAYEAVLALETSKLPAHYSVVHYPYLDSATEYPTLGPQGESTMDVNGLACSIELYLGDDVLRRQDGELIPVQWKGFMGKVKKYQGEVMDKSAIQRAFDDKVKRARQDPGCVGQQDWQGLRSVLERLITALALT